MTATGMSLRSGRAAAGLGASALGCNRAHALLKTWKGRVAAYSRKGGDMGTEAEWLGMEGSESCSIFSSFDGCWIGYSPAVFDIDFSPSTRGVTHAHVLYCKDQDLTINGDSPICSPRGGCSAEFSAEFDVVGSENGD